MRVFVSPYHLTTREPPAMASLLLASSVVTMTPAPGGNFGQTELRRLTQRSPRYMRFVESWAWTRPLWQAGVLGGGIAGEDAGHDVRDVREMIDREQDFAPLRPLMKTHSQDDETEYLDALAGDLLKGGPDPAVCIPLTAGIDRFASRHAALVARAEASSIAQRAEEKLGRRVFAVAVPILSEAGAETVLALRERVAPELSQFREAIDGAIAGDTAALVPAAAAYTAAFERELPNLPKNKEAQRTVPAMVSLIALELPADAALRSSVAAAGVLGLRLAPAPKAKPGALAVTDPARSGRFIALIVKVIGARRKG